MPQECLSPRNNALKSKRSSSESRHRCPEQHHDRGKSSSGRSSSAARSPRPYEAHTIESLNKRRGPYDETKYNCSGEKETRYCVQQTDEEESWTAENFVPKLEECLDALKRIAKKIGTFYNKETHFHTPQPPAQKTIQRSHKTVSRTPVRPLSSSVSEEILHLLKKIDVIEKAIQVLLKGTDQEQLKDLQEKIASADDENTWLRNSQQNLQKKVDEMERRNQELALEVSSKNEDITFYHSENRRLEEEQKTGLEQMQVLKEKIASLGAENAYLWSRQQGHQEEVDAMKRRNQELVSEISSKNEEITVYHSGKKRPEKDEKRMFPVKMSKTNDENARLKRIESAHQNCEKKQKQNETEIQRLKNKIDEQASKEKLLRYEVDTVKNESLKCQKRNKDCEGEMKKLEKICRDQREEINLKNQEISHLKAETVMKSEQIKQTTVKIEIRKKEIAEANLLKRKDEKLGEENVSLKEKIKACEEEDGHLKRELERFNRQAIEREREWKRFANEKESHLKKLQEAMKKKDREIDRMKVECKYINEGESKYKELKATVSLIYQEKDGKIASLQREIDRLTQGWEKARRKLDQKNADYEGAIEELNGLREDYKNVKKEYYDQDRRLKDEKRMRVKMTQEMERKIDRVDQLENDLHMEKMKNERLRQEITRISTELDQKEEQEREKYDESQFFLRERSELELDVTHLNDRLQKMELDIISEKQSMKSQRAEMEYKLQSKEREIKELTDEINRAREETEVLQQEINDGEESKIKISNLLQSRIESLQGDLAHAKDKLSVMQKKNKQIEEEKKNAEYQCSEFEKTFSTFEEELKLKYEIARTDSLHNLNMEKEKQIRKLQQDNSTLHESEKHLMKKIETLQANFNTVKEEKTLINNDLFEKEKEISVLNHELRSLQNKDDIRKETEKQKQAVSLEQKSVQIELDQVKARLTEQNKEMKAVKDNELRIQSAMNNLETENMSLQSELQKLRTSLEELQKKSDHMKREKTDKEKRYRNVEKKSREYEEEVKELRRQLKSFQETTYDNRKESEKEAHVLLRENKALQGELEQIKSRRRLDAEEMKSMVNENEDNKQLHLRAVKEVKDKEREITDLRRQLIGLQGMEKNLDLLKREKMDKEKYYRNIEKKNREKEEEVTELRRQLKSLQEATYDNRKESEKEAHVLLRENKALQGELEQIKSRVRSDAEEMKSVMKENEDNKDLFLRAAKEVKEKEREINDLQKQLIGLQDMEGKLDLVKREKMDKEKDYRNVEKKNREKEEEVTELRRQLKRVRSEAEEMKSMMKENQDDKQLYLRATKEVKDKEREITDLRRQLIGLRETEELMKKINKEKIDLEVKNSTQSRQLQDIKDEKNRLLTHIESLQHRLSDQRMQTKKANENDVHLKVTVESLETENSSLQSKLQELRSRLQQASQNFELVKKEKMDTEQYYWRIEKDNKKKQQEIEDLRRDLNRNSELISKYEAVQKEKERLEEISSGLRRDLQSKEQEIHRSRDEISRLTNNLTVIEREADLLKKTYSHDENKGRVILEEKTKIEKELTDVKSTVDQLMKECKDLHRDKDNADKKCIKMSKAIREKEDEAEHLADKLATTEEKLSALAEDNERLRRSPGHDSTGINQKLQRENNALQSELERVTSNFEERISMLVEENKKLRISPDHSGGIIQRLERKNTTLQSELERVASNLDQLKRDYTEVKKEKDHALNRLSSVAGEKLRDNNPGIADLSDENRPINLGEKFSQLYDDQWTDAMENLEENLRFGETDGIRCLLNILKRVFDECVRISDEQFTQLKEITGTTNLPSDQLKKLKDLRKSTALQSVKNVKQLVNKTMSAVFGKEKVACQSYIDRSTELCWLMSVQDPPVVIDFTAVHGQEMNDKTFRKFTKTGSKIDFLVWPMIRLHKSGPLLQKGVVQPI
ncbi:trichohyalin-like isoform X2 [Ostrea edulis]|uniref:trichohyalin-like isoform X2 n=1 Tax=Ostrea edulis TaxID=37623 RepID=UPI0024AFB20E|nr:trichohyalin-like isoform X2 [Ostrea edulis]